MVVYAVMCLVYRRAYRNDGDSTAEIVGVFKDFNEALEATKKTFEDTKAALEYYGESFEYFEREEMSDDFWDCSESDLESDDELNWYAEVDGEAIGIQVTMKRFSI